MDKDKITQIIQDEVKNYLLKKEIDKNNPKIKSIVKPSTLFDKTMKDMDVDKHLFYGGETEDKIESSKQRYLKEEENKSNITITTSEIKDFETKFKNNVSDQVVFHKQSNGTSIYAYVGASGIEAKCSGIIPFTSDNKIKWEYSIQNGIFVDIKSELSTELIDILEALNSFYISWDQEWTEKLSAQ